MFPGQVYYSLDIRNDSNEAMHAKEYFSSREDLGAENKESGQMDHFNLVVKDTANSSEYGHGGGGTSGTSPVPQAVLRHGPQSQNFWEESVIQTSGGMVETVEDPHPAQASRADFHKFLFTDGNWTDLFATSFNWMLLDFTFYLLGVNSSSFVPTMFGEKIGALQSPYDLLISNEKHIMESTSVGALIGSACAILVVHYYSRRKLQMWGYLILGALFVVVGGLYVTLPTTNAHVTIILFYGICQLFYNLGKIPMIEKLKECGLT